AQVKAILETGILVEPDLIRQAATLAVEGGADFIKTSTGKVPVNATPEAARIMLEVIEASGGQVGLKAAGGVRTTQDALRYLDLCDEIMGDGWATPRHFRIGASSLLAVLLATLDGTDAAPAEGY
ncbi:MAG: deoxyribose-phosphate aldolase, partial [Pseudomonadota bacterium]